MKVEDSIFKDSYLLKITESFGTFYVFEKFVISEINEGEQFDWEKGEKIVKKVKEYFNDPDIKLGYISNRIYSYSLSPQDWLHFFRERHRLTCFAIVAYNEWGLLSIALEKIFFKARIKKFEHLELAVKWTLKFSEKEKAHSY